MLRKSWNARWHTFGQQTSAWEIEFKVAELEYSSQRPRIILACSKWSSAIVAIYISPNSHCHDRQACLFSATAIQLNRCSINKTSHVDAASKYWKYSHWHVQYSSTEVSIPKIPWLLLRVFKSMGHLSQERKNPACMYVSASLRSFEIRGNFVADFLKSSGRHTWSSTAF